MKNLFALFTLLPCLSLQVPGQVPTISSFTPTSGPVGTSVTIIGTNFNSTASNDIVYFGAVKASISSADSTQIIIQVPVGATSALIIVTDTTKRLTAYSSVPFMVTFVSSRVIDASSLADKVNFATSSVPCGVAIGDFDGDGKPDLAIANAGSSSISVFRNQRLSDGINFAGKIDISAGSAPQGIAVGDFNGDGKPDLAVGNAGGNSVSVFRNTSTSDSISFAPEVDLPAWQPYGLAIRDLDGDGKPDLAVTNIAGQTVSVFRNTSTSDSTSFAGKIDITTDFVPKGLAIGDFDGDGKPDLAVVNYASNNVSIFRNTSTRDSVSFAAKVYFITGSYPSNVAIGDFDGDGKPDLAVTNGFDDDVSVFRNTSTIGTVGFAYMFDFATGNYPDGVVVGDFDGDGKSDLAVTNYGGNSVSLLRNTSIGSAVNFSTNVKFTTGRTPWAIAVGDFDGDGKPDLAVTNSEDNSVSAFRNRATLSAPTLISPSNNAVNQPKNLTLRWNSSLGATSYGVQVATDSHFVSDIVVNDSTVRDTTRTVSGLSTAERYYWQVSAKNASGSSPWSSLWSFITSVTTVPTKQDYTIPQSFALHQNYPNPFNPSTMIHLELPKESYVTLKIYNMLGQEVMNVINERRNVGRYDFQLDASSLPSGVYFYRLIAGDFTSTKKFILLR